MKYCHNWCIHFQKPSDYQSLISLSLRPSVTFKIWRNSLIELDSGQKRRLKNTSETLKTDLNKQVIYQSKTAAIRRKILGCILGLWCAWSNDSRAKTINQAMHQEKNKLSTILIIIQVNITINGEKCYVMDHCYDLKKPIWRQWFGLKSSSATPQMQLKALKNHLHLLEANILGCWREKS